MIGVGAEEDRVTLLGRRAEREVVGQPLAGARARRSGVLVVRGEAGIGKSAVLEHVRGAAVSTGFRVQPSVGAESETQFAFSGLHQLCAPLIGPRRCASAAGDRAITSGGPARRAGPHHGSRDAPA